MSPISPQNTPIVPAHPAMRLTAAVAIPAKDEATEIAGCLRAIADQVGTPLDDFAVVLVVNNSTDATAAIARRLRGELPYLLFIHQARFSSGHVGRARRMAMDAAAALLGPGPGLILTTDADSRVAPDWLAANRAAIARGVDAVAGAIAFDTTDAERRGPAGLLRAAREERYAAAIAEIEARLDPQRHDPWPRHRTASGASLALTLDAYRAIGGLPPVAVGEDRALAAAVEAAGLRLRHDPAVWVATSSRLDGRALGGAADTLRRRRDAPDDPCDVSLEPISAALSRILWRRRLRKASASGALAADRNWAEGLGLAPGRGAEIARMEPFGRLWHAIEAESPRLRPVRLSPRRLPGSIAAARFTLRLMDASDAALRTFAGGRDDSARAARGARPARSDGRL